MSHDITQWADDWTNPELGVMGKIYRARCNDCGVAAEAKVTNVELILAKIDIKKYTEQRVAEELFRQCDKNRITS